jgi:hypothetical protein
VPITPAPDDPEDFLELSKPEDGLQYDRSDRKFLAVAAAHPDHPPILQALDSKWWGWPGSVRRDHVTIHFLCPKGDSHDVRQEGRQAGEREEGQGAPQETSMTGYFRFPHTPHVTCLDASTPRKDKVLTSAQARHLLAGDVVVEEKVDGANLGFSVDASGELRAQNRGSYVDLDAPKGQWKPLLRWLPPRRSALVAALAPDLMLFGEWCYAAHSVRYTHLADWFLAFDVHDRSRRHFWSVDRRNDLAARLGVQVVPEVARGHFTLPGLVALLGRSRFSDGSAEGLYVRRESGGLLLDRAKLVRAGFVQAIDGHWSQRRLEANRLA